MVGGRGGAQTTKSFWKMGTKTEKKTGNALFLLQDAMQILHNWLNFTDKRNFFPAARERSFRKCSNDSYTRITKLCNSYGDEDS